LASKSVAQVDLSINTQAELSINTQAELSINTQAELSINIFYVFFVMIVGTYLC